MKFLLQLLTLVAAFVILILEDISEPQGYHGTAVERNMKTQPKLLYVMYVYIVNAA